MQRNQSKEIDEMGKSMIKLLKEGVKISHSQIKRLEKELKGLQERVCKI